MTSLDIFSELLYSIAHIQTLVAKDLILESLEEINATLSNVKNTDVIPTETKEKTLVHLETARDLLAQDGGKQSAADSIWQAYVEIRISG